MNGHAEGRCEYLRVVLTGVGTTRFLASGGGGDGLNRALENVAELESLHEVAVPDHAPVLDTDLVEGLVDLADLLDTLVQGFLGTVAGMSAAVT